MGDVVFPPTHKSPRRLNVPFNELSLPSPAPPMGAILAIPKVVYSSTDHIVRQIYRKASSLPDWRKWRDAEDEKMASAVD